MKKLSILILSLFITGNFAFAYVSFESAKVIAAEYMLHSGHANKVVTCENVTDPFFLKLCLTKEALLVPGFPEIELIYYQHGDLKFGYQNQSTMCFDTVTVNVNTGSAFSEGWKCLN